MNDVTIAWIKDGTEESIEDGANDLIATDPTSDRVFLCSVRRDTLYGSPFLTLPSKGLLADIRDGRSFRLGAYEYHVAPKFRKPLAALIRQAKIDPKASVQAIIVTVQESHTVRCFLGNGPEELAEMMSGTMPPELLIKRTVSRRRSLEKGRKVGAAAKDKALLTQHALGLNELKKLELIGNEEAFEAVSKEVILPVRDYEELRANEVPPAIAFLWITLRRRLPKRPQNDRKSRELFVGVIPELFEAIENANGVEKVRELLHDAEDTLNERSSDVVGNRFFTCLDHWTRRRRPGVMSEARAIERCGDLAKANRMALELLAAPVSIASPQVKPLPSRRMESLDRLRRTGACFKIANAGEQLVDTFGLTGIEIGNWVRDRESELLLKLTVESFSDLNSIVGPWLPHMIRRGNLAIAFGSRGKGRSCAHYEAARKVINLTKMKGDGSLAHEVGHFIDHMAASYASPDKHRFLSGRVEKQSAQNAVAAAMRSTMDSIQLKIVTEEYEGNPSVRRYYRPGMIHPALKKHDDDLQAVFESIAANDPVQFLSGRYALDNSRLLVDSIARVLGKPCIIQLSCAQTTNYIREIKKLTPYWRCTEELFARAFESFIEDELFARGYVSEFLVRGTRESYSNCRANPYPTGDERKAICIAMRQFMDVLGNEAWA